VNLRYVVPALGLVALSVSAASAQEIAKGVNLDGYVDTIGTATRGNDAYGDSSTDFSSEAVLKIGWAPTDRISALVVTRNGSSFGSPTGSPVAGADTTTFAVTEAYGTIKATDQLTISSGKSTGPFGYYSQYATGVNFITGVLSTALYTVNPTGAWATWTPNEKASVTAIVANTFFGNNKANRPASVSPGVDVVFNATPELSLNLELLADPNGSPTLGTDGTYGDIYLVGFNAQYKKDALTVAGEFLYQVVQNNGATADDDQKNLSYAAFVTYAIPGAKIPMAVTAQLSGYKLGETGPLDSHTATKGQLALLTNPLNVSQFGLNGELFYLSDDAGNGTDKESSYGVAIEGLYVLP